MADKLEIQCVISQLDSIDASVASLIRSMQKNNRNGFILANPTTGSPDKHRTFYSHQPKKFHKRD